MPGPVTGGIASKIFADGAALLAGLADYPGQVCTTADGVAWTVARGTGAGGTYGAVVNLNDLVYFNQIRPTTIDAAANAGGLAFAGGAHRLNAVGGTFLDNTLVLGNETGGFAAVTLQKTGSGFSAYPCGTFGTSGAVSGSEYNGVYIATKSPDGIVDPLNIGLYHEQPGRGSHRRIYCTYGSSGVTTCYGFDPAGAVTGILVADPIGWQVNAAGEMGVRAAPETGFALKVTGNLKVTGAIAGGAATFTTLLFQATIAARSTTPINLTTADSGVVNTNEGAPALNVQNLPTAVAGLIWEGAVQDADGIQVVAAAGDTIRIAGSVSATAGNAQSTTIGSTLTLKAINSVEWFAFSVSGSWTVT